MRAVFVLCLAAALLVLCACAAVAAVPKTMSYQGVLRDAIGNVVPDGAYSVMFAIYDVDAGGSALWAETQALSVEGGILNAILGSVVPIALDFDTTYWLGISIEGEAELTPRTELTSAPYAQRATFADVVAPLTLPYSGVVSDTSDAFAVSNMGSGTTFRGHAGGSGEAAFFSNGDPVSSAAVLHAYSVGTGPALHAHAGGGGRAGVFDGDVYVGGGAVGIGVPNPVAGLEISGPAKMTGFQLTAAPTAGYVLTSDATGVGTWEAAPGTIGGAGTTDYVPKFTSTNTIGNSAIYESSGRVSIGSTTTDAALRLSYADSIPALKIENTSSGSGFDVIELSRTQPLAEPDAFITMDAPLGTDDYAYFLKCWRTTATGGLLTFSVAANGDISTWGSLSLQTDWLDGVHAGTTWESSDGAGVVGEFLGGAYDGVGVRGDAAQLDYYGYGGYFEGGYVGAYGLVEPTGAEEYRGLYGRCNGGTGTNFGVLGAAGGSGTNYGVYGSASGTGTNWAGYFDGDVRITGTLTNPAPQLEMDHPSDPENTYLRHALVASSEMKTVYDGTVVLDAVGEAIVELPDWFEALNTDFRYQLTAIGAPGPNLYVADKISGNAFRIAGGEPGMEVCWQVTGVRHDADAEANRLEVEVNKSADERGRYLHPEVYGAPPTSAIGRVEDSDKLQRTRG